MKCPHCRSERVIKAGKTERKYVTRQGYRCKDCKRYFVERDGCQVPPVKDRRHESSLLQTKSASVHCFGSNHRSETGGILSLNR